MTKLRKQLENMALIDDPVILGLLMYPTVVFSLEEWDSFWGIKQRSKDPVDR